MSDTANGRAVSPLIRNPLMWAGALSAMISIPRLNYFPGLPAD